MKRKCKLFIQNTQTSVSIYIDEANEELILAYIKKDNRHLKKFKFITDLILQCLINRELYDKEEVSLKARGVTAMKFFKGQENDRVYCKEFKETGKELKLIMVELYEKKKGRKLNKKEIQMIERIGGYEYEI